MTTINIETKDHDGEKEIAVDKDTVVTKKAQTLKFFNNLDGNPNAVVTFHSADGKKTPVPGFCTQSTGASIEVLPKKMALCTVAKGKKEAWDVFNYSVASQPATHEPLDPVIIIQPTGQFLPVPVVLAIVVGIGALTGWIGFRIGRAEFR